MTVTRAAAALLLLTVVTGCTLPPVDNTSSGGVEPGPVEARLCEDLILADDVTGIGSSIDVHSDSGDVTTQMLQAEDTVRLFCPDVLWKLDRYREQVVEPALGG